MKKLILTALVLAVMTFIAGTAEAARRRCRNYAPVAVQPAPVATAQAQPGYRAFSYQPATGATMRTTRVRSAQPGYLNAGTKALGRY